MKSALQWMALLLLLAGCGEKTPPPPAVTPPAVERPVYRSGEVVAHHDERVVEDTLNDLRFIVDIIAEERSNETGVFRMKSEFSGMASDARFQLPAGAVARPALRRGSPGYVVIAGFVTLKDSQFYEQYRITGSDSQLSVQRTKQYASQ